MIGWYHYNESKHKDQNQEWSAPLLFVTSWNGPFGGLYLSQDLIDIRSFRVSAKLSMAASPADTGFQLQYETTEVFLFHLGKNYDSEVYSGLTNFF